MRRLFFSCLLLVVVVSPLHAALPVLHALFPAGGQQGTTFTLAANGVMDPDVRLWTDCPGVHFVPNGKKREWQVTILPTAPPGPHLVRAINADGVSAPCWFSIGTLPELAEVEPNDELGKAQSIDKLPICINARLEKAGDVDGYTVKLAAGQTLVGMAEAYALGSSVDMLAHIVDDQGIRILTVSDGRNLDPNIVFKAPKAGLYTLQIAGFSHPPAADVRFVGGVTAVYRLHLSTGPVATEIFPAAAVLDAKTEAELIGYGLDPKKSRYTVAPLSKSTSEDIVALAIPGAILPLQAAVTSRAALIEKEPNNELAQAMPLKVEDAVGGHITDKDPLDRYSVQAKKGDHVLLRVFARQLGSLLDPVLQVCNAEGKSIADIDDLGENADPQYLWTAPSDGLFQIIVKDRFNHGGDNFFYLLALSAPKPSFEATLPDGKPLVLEPGKTVGIKATVKLLNGFKEPLIARVSGLPPGVHASEVPVAEKGGEVEIKLLAAPNAEPSQTSIQVTFWTKAEPVTFRSASFPLRGENLRGTSLLDFSDTFWLLVAKSK